MHTSQLVAEVYLEMWVWSTASPRGRVYPPYAVIFFSEEIPEILGHTPLANLYLSAALILGPSFYSLDA